MSIRIPTLGKILTVSHGRGTMSRSPGLWRGLVGAWPMQDGGGLTAHDVSGFGNNGTLTAMDPATDWVVTEKGRALQFGGSAAGEYVGFSPIAFGTGPWTFSSWIDIVSNYTTYGFLANAGWTARVQMNSDVPSHFYLLSLTGASAVWTNIVYLGRKHYSIVCSGAAGITLYVDGISQGVQATPAGGFTFSTIGCRTPASTSSLDGSMCAPGLWSRALAPSEIQELYADPWAMYTLRPRVFAAAAAGGVSEITGTCAIAVTPSGALTGAGALAGSVAIAATPSGSMVGSGALAGSSAVAVTPSGALAGSGALLGSAAVAVTPTGALSGAGALAGSSTVAVTPSGALAGSGALSGSAAVAVTPSGSLAGSGALAGSSAISVTLSVTLTGGGIVPFLSVLYSQAG